MIFDTFNQFAPKWNARILNTFCEPLKSQRMQQQQHRRAICLYIIHKMSRINDGAANLHNNVESIAWIMQFVCAGDRMAATHAHDHFIDP